MTDGSGLTITSLEDVEALMKNLGIKRSSGLHSVYRGQVKDWPLLSGLGRIDKSIPELELLEKPLLLDFDELVKSECPGLLQEFGFTEKYSEGKLWSLLFQAQHLGLPTRLLDWSSSIHTAVSFAVDTEFDFDGVLWIYSSPEILSAERKAEYLNLSLNQVNSLLMICDPSLADRDKDKNIGAERKSKQNGLFSVQNLNLVKTPLENQPFLTGHLLKVVIPNGAKSDLKRALTKFGKTKKNLMIREDVKVTALIDKLMSNFRNTQIG